LLELSYSIFSTLDYLSQQSTNIVPKAPVFPNQITLTNENHCRNFEPQNVYMSRTSSPNGSIDEGKFGSTTTNCGSIGVPQNDGFTEEFDGRLNLNDELLLSPAYITQPVEMKSDLQILCKFGSVGSAPGQLGMPHGFCIGMDDQIVIADTNNHRISVFGITGNFIFCFGEKGTSDGHLYLPRKVKLYCF